jgi:hypothetical protein
MIKGTTENPFVRRYREKMEEMRVLYSTDKRESDARWHITFTS